MAYGPEQYDSMLDAAIERAPNTAVSWFLMASYLYYHRDASLLTDERYDRLCIELDMLWPELTHCHLDLIDRESLKAGTGYSLPVEKYPTIVTHAASAMVGIPWIDHAGVTEPEKKPVKFTIKKKTKLSFGKKSSGGKVLSFGRSRS